MQSEDRPTKIIVAVNKGLEPGRGLNAGAHAVLGLASMAGGGEGLEEFEVIDYETADAGGFLASKLPLVILKASPTHLRRLLDDLSVARVKSTAFHSGMVEGTWQDQVGRSAAAKAEDLELFAVAAIGEAQTIDPLTKRCRLY
jgi:uncharacterized protein DUF2000